MNRKIIALILISIFVVSSTCMAAHGLGRKKVSPSPQYDRYSNRYRYHKDNLLFLTEILATNKDLTREQKRELACSFEVQCPGDVRLRTEKNKEDIAYFEQTANDMNLTMSQKKKALKNYMANQRRACKGCWSIKATLFNFWPGGK